LDHAVDAAAVDGFPGVPPQDQWPFDALAAARLEDAEHRHCEGHGGWLGALADQVQDTVTAECLGLVLDAHGGGFGRTQRVDPKKVRQCAVMHG
jgi:hypothetical protein